MAYSDFLIAGSGDQDRTRAYLATANFLGNDAIWLLLPPKGELVGLVGKFLPWRTKLGELRWQASRLDGPALTVRATARPNDYGDIGFQSDTVDFPEPGCWEITYSLNAEYSLRFILHVQKQAS